MTQKKSLLYSISRALQYTHESMKKWGKQRSILFMQMRLLFRIKSKKRSWLKRKAQCSNIHVLLRWVYGTHTSMYVAHSVLPVLLIEDCMRAYMPIRSFLDSLFLFLSRMLVCPACKCVAATCHWFEKEIKCLYILKRAVIFRALVPGSKIQIQDFLSRYTSWSW